MYKHQDGCGMGGQAAATLCHIAVWGWWCLLGCSQLTLCFLVSWDQCVGTRQGKHTWQSAQCS